MKKEYKNPSMEVIEIATQQMLAGSPGGQNMLDPNSSSNPNLFEGRGNNSDWDEDDF